ncbi:DNA-binding domain-containing protein [Legionella erythra]|uniref:Putative DNA-binding domain-containing protein n=1 Tax=Legionella erythra TaxID=448 RepID=A0A0W0TRH6_LEGER|nr:DNA-binding domain-containing protein [Legionella erythra]KTC98150.1 hypothetical protein Lery_1204 [Legionella erythra]
MTNLAAIQRQLQAYLLAQDADIGGHPLEDLIVSTPTVPARTRARIYKEAYQSRLLEALSNNFPCLKRYVGDEAFQRFGAGYADQNPSSYRSIRWFGHQFPAFLSDHLNDEYRVVVELAEFEWAMALAFDAEDLPAVTINEMALIPPERWENLHFTTHPSLQTLALSWNAPTLWEALNQGKPPPAAVKQDRQSWLLWRQEYLNHFYLMAPDEAWAMGALQQGLVFGEICMGLCRWHNENEVGIRAAGLLQKWVQSQMIVKVLFKD